MGRNFLEEDGGRGGEDNRRGGSRLANIPGQTKPKGPEGDPEAKAAREIRPEVELRR